MSEKFYPTFTTRSGNRMTVEYERLRGVGARDLPVTWDSPPSPDDLNDFREYGAKEMDEQFARFLYGG